MTLVAGTRLGPYEVLEPLGKGGMGEVYRARDARLDRIVAVKVLPASLTHRSANSSARFQREARAASRLSHPHICAVYDVGEHDGVHFIVMEYLEGESLAERLRRGPLPPPELLTHATDVADALDHAHHAGIVHRDLKPANMMLTRSGVKLLDFGVASLRAHEGSTSDQPTESITEEGTLLGTVQYMAPEQLEGRETDGRTDIFAFGSVVYEMATGRPAFEGASRASLIAAILEHEPPSLSAAVAALGASRASAAGWTPPLLEHVVSRCLAKNPDERWQTAADVRAELKWIASSSAQLRTSPPAVGRRTPRRRRVVWTASAALLTIAAALYVVPRVEWRGNASSGPPTFKQLTFRRGNITMARFAPDGQTILYSAAVDGGLVQVFETRPNGPESKVIAPPGTGLASVSSNELALFRNCQLDGGSCRGTLARMPLAGGAPRDVLEDVVSADWSPDGKDLAVAHVWLGESRVEFPPGTRVYATTGEIGWLAFSPKGDRIAFVEHPILVDESGLLRVIDLKGRTILVSAGWKTIRGVRWSPSGDAIWVTGSRTAKICSLFNVSMSGKLRLVLNTSSDILVHDVAPDGRLLLTSGTSRARIILAKDGKERDLSWLDWSTLADVSADGKTVLFHEWGVGAGANPIVYSRQTNGADAVRLGDGKALSLSPDGRWALALVEGDHPQFVILPTGTGERRFLPADGLIDVFWAKWFPDGHRLLVVATGADRITRSYFVDVDTGRRQEFAEPGALAMLVSPDGQRVLVRDPLSGFDIWPAAGGDPVPVHGLLPDDRPIRWTDGILYVRSGDDDALRLYRYHFASKRRELWRELAPLDPTGVISLATGRGELAITPDGASVIYTYWTLLDELFLVAGVR